MRTEYKLADFNYIVRKASNPVLQYGYTGPCWAHISLASHLLYYGVIDWSDITHCYTSKGHLPAGLFTKPFRTMEAAWQDVDDSEHMCKLSINSFIGIMCINENKMYKHSCSTLKEDIPLGASLSSCISYGNHTLYDFVTVTDLKSNVSMRPVHDMTLCMEAVRVGQMIYMCRAMRAIPYEIKTDSLLYKPQKRKNMTLDELSFRDLDTLRSQYSETPGMRKLNQHTIMTAFASAEKVFRSHRATEADKLRVECTNPKNTATLTIHERKWQTLQSREEAEEWALKGGSILIEGIAGTGKSHLAKTIVERLQSLGKKVVRIRKTHVASSRIDGITADLCVRRSTLAGTPSLDVLFVDEIGQLDISLWSQLCKLLFLKKNYNTSLREMPIRWAQ